MAPHSGAQLARRTDGRTDAQQDEAGRHQHPRGVPLIDTVARVERRTHHRRRQTRRRVRARHPSQQQQSAGRSSLESHTRGCGSLSVSVSVSVSVVEPVQDPERRRLGGEQGEEPEVRVSHDDEQVFDRVPG